MANSTQYKPLWWHLVEQNLLESFSLADRFQFDPRSTFFFRDVPSEYLNPSAAETSKQGRKDLTVDLANHHRSQSQETSGSPGGAQGGPGSRSAFRAVHQGEPLFVPEKSLSKERVTHESFVHTFFFLKRPDHLCSIINSTSWKYSLTAFIWIVTH